MTTDFASPRISVIMPCYNAAAFVAESVTCVMGQTLVDVELIVVDDGSTDASVEILQRLAAKHSPRMSLLFQGRMGPYPARNLALQHARGERIAFLDADDYWSADCLQKLSDAMDTSGADLAYCGWQNVGTATPGTIPFIPPDYSAIDTAAEFLRSCPWPIHAALVKRTVIEAVNGFSERCFSAMDYDLWLRIYAHTQRLVRVPEVLAFYRWHNQGQISGTKWKQVLDAHQVRRDFVVDHPERVAHLPPNRVRDLSEGFLLREAYRSFWQRDLINAQKLFRRAFLMRLWALRDLRYILPAMLPGPTFAWLVHSADHVKGRRA